MPLYFLGKCLSGRVIAIGASLLYVFSSFSLFLSHDGRVYSIVAMLSVWSVYLFFRQCKEPNRVRWIMLTGVNILIMYSHYLALWVVIVEVVVALTVPDIRRRLGRNFAIHWAVLVGAYIPQVPVLFSRFLSSGLHGTWVEKCTGIDDLYQMFCSFTNAPVTTTMALTVAVAALIKVVVLLVKRKYVPSKVLILTMFWVLPLMVSFGLSFKVGFFLNRYFYFLLPLWLLSIMTYVAFLLPNKTVCARVVMLVLFTAMAFSFKIDSRTMRYAGWKGDVSRVASRVMELTEEMDACVVVSPHWMDKQLVYYLDGTNELFSTQGRLEEPAFYDYLRHRGWFYDFEFVQALQSDQDHIIIVAERWVNVTDMIQQCEQQGYIEVLNEEFQQQAIILLTKVFS